MSGAPTGVENMVGGLNECMAGAWEGLKILSKNTCDGVHLIVKLPAISLQACKFTKNELLLIYFWRILARRTSSHFVEGCFTFQWGLGERCFSDGGASFLSSRAPHGGFWWWRDFEKYRWMGARCPPCPPPGETLHIYVTRIFMWTIFFMRTSHWKLRKVSSFA